MAVIRFSSFVLVLLFIFYHARGSIAQTYKAMEKTVVVVDKDMPDHYQSGLTNKEIYEDVPPAADEVRKTKLGGRKMVLKRVLVKKMVNMVGLDERRLQAPENSGATQFVGNCHNKGKGMMLKVECKLMSTKRSLRPVKVQMAGYIPFNADYHIPRPHPPKNN